MDQDKDFTQPDHNLLIALIKGTYDFPFIYYKIQTNSHYSTHSNWSKFVIAILKTFLKNLHYKQLQIFSPNEDIKSSLNKINGKTNNNDDNNNIVKLLGLNKFGEKLSDKFPNAYWLKEKENRNERDPIVLFYHGGGYLFEFRNDTHLKFLLNLTKNLSSNYSILLIDYPLTSYPEPLNYNLKLWEYLFNELNLSNVITIGDSSGGHLILDTLATIQTQNIKISLPSNEKFKHVLLSPWIDLSLDFVKFNHDDDDDDIEYASENFDILDYKILYSWGKIFTKFSNPINLLKHDFKGLINDKNTIITIGELEIIKNSVEYFSKSNKLPLLFEKQGVHDQITMMDFLGYDEGENFHKIVKFITEV